MKQNTEIYNYPSLLKKYTSSPLLIPFQVDEAYEHVTITTTICKSQPIHMHDCLEIIYVVKGTIKAKVSYSYAEINEGEFLCLNSFELHSIEALEEGTVVSSILFDKEIFDYGDGFIAWWFEDQDVQYSVYKSLSLQVKSIIKSHALNSPDFATQIDNLIKNIRLNFLVERFDISTRLSNQMERDDVLLRIHEVYLYFYGNYDRKLTLNEIANHFNVSKYYLSHFIKRACGFNITEMLAIIRCDRAEIALLGTTQSIASIAEEHGFSSTKYFNSAFSNIFGYTPNEYRKKYRVESIPYKLFDEEEVTDIKSYLDLDISNLKSNSNRIEFVFPHNIYNATVIEMDSESTNTPFSINSNQAKTPIELTADEYIIRIKKFK